MLSVCGMPASASQICCHMLAGMQVLGRIVEHVRTLCQDLQHTVRECMCASVVVPLVRSLGPEKAATIVLADVLELIEVRSIPVSTTQTHMLIEIRVCTHFNTHARTHTHTHMSAC